MGAGGSRSRRERLQRVGVSALAERDGLGQVASSAVERGALTVTAQALAVPAGRQRS